MQECQPLTDDPSCRVCAKPPGNHIASALYERYSSSQNFFYTKGINELLGESLTATTVAMLEWQVLDEEDEFLKREYRLLEYQNKCKSLGDYYQYHKQLPRFFGMPIEMTIQRYYDKVRDYEYKVVKRMMNETEESFFDPSMAPTQTDISKKSLSNVLAELSQPSIKLQESTAFFHVVEELKMIPTGPDNNFDLKGSFPGSANLRNFELYLQKMLKRKRRTQMSLVSIDRKPPLFRKEDQEQSEAKVLELVTYRTQNPKFKSKLSDRVDTILSGLEKTKPILKRLTVEIPKILKTERERSIEKIYGTLERQHLTQKQSLKFMTLQSDRPREKEAFKCFDSKHSSNTKELNQVKAIDFQPPSNSTSKKQFRVSLRPEQPPLRNTTTRKKERSDSDASFKRKSQSVPNIKQLKLVRQHHSKPKLDPIKIYKKIKGMP